MTAFMLAIPDRCFVVLDLSGFPPNSLVNFSMLALKDGLVYKFLDDQYRNDVPVDEDGDLDDFVMGPVWVEPDPRDPFAEISVIPMAYSPSHNLTASADPMLIQPVCNPD
jgi:hypothetical protein